MEYKTYLHVCKHRYFCTCMFLNLIIPPAKRSFRGVYCFQPVRDSVIPSFRDSVIPSFRHSVNIWTSLLNNLSSFCLICFKFSPHLHHQTIHVWYEFRGQRVSIARVMGLFKSSYNMFAIVLKVHTLWNQLLLQLSMFPFNILLICFRYIADVHEQLWCWKNHFWQIYSIFNLANFL